MMARKRRSWRRPTSTGIHWLLVLDGAVPTAIVDHHSVHKKTVVCGRRPQGRRRHCGGGEIHRTIECGRR